ncbi:MAG: hypothetical protein P4M11_06455 [Candidatus Pacebacteria bacterium]|nr:hypothetical protein [Candidatus Paceibacterota bacterium]
MRRTLIIIAIVLVLIGIGVVAYFTFGPSAAHLTVTSGNPFGGATSGATTTIPTTGETETNSGAGTVVAPNLIQITSAAVSGGFIALDIAPATSTVSLASTTTRSTPASPGDIEVRYIDRQSGNTYAFRSMARSLTRISDKTLPGIQEASWLPDGSMALARFLSDSGTSESLDTYALPSDGSDGFFLAQNLTEAKVIGQNSVFTLSSGVNGSIGAVSQMNGANSSTIFTSPLSSIIVYPAGGNFIAVSKAASELGGYAFSINPTTGVFTPILGPLRGLTVLPSPSGKLVLYSYTDGSVFRMGVFNLSTDAVTSLPLATLAEKCAWSNDSSSLYCGVPTSFAGNIPDDWYQGVTSFNDRLWRIDLTSRIATLLIDPSQSKKSIDIVNPTIDQNSRLLVFRNKKDSSLWAYSL